MSACRRAAMLVALSVGVLLLRAGPADAHAVLLRTEPSPQSTSPTAPSVVALEFSESVEVTFGAVRVFDVDGDRVDAGSVRRARGDRRVEAPLKRLRDGTYTVTWRVVSADGHPVQGGFQFYVGAPSSISPVAVSAETGKRTLLGWSYGAVRFGWFLALLGMVGVVTVRRFVWTPALRGAGLADSDAALLFRRRFSLVLPACLGLLAVSTAATLIFQAATASGLSLGDSIHARVLRDVLDTGFGQAWKWQAALVVAAALPIWALLRTQGLWRIRPDAWIAALGVASFGIALAAGAGGHARTDSRPALATASIGVHLLAVGVWVGGLLALVALGRPAWRRLDATRRTALVAETVPRFSRVALGAVAVVVITGVINSIDNLASFSDLWDTTYGRALTAKIALLAAALVLAWRHLRLPRRLAQDEKGAVTAARRFDLTSLLEAVLLVAAVAVAAGLVVLIPGRSLALAGNGPVNLSETAAGSYAVQLFIDPSKAGANEVHLTFVSPSGVGAAEVTNATATLLPESGPPTRLTLRLIAPGHFVADTDLAAGRYRLSAEGRGAPTTLAATFDFRVGASGDQPKENP